jgi:ferrous iron transport protein A
MNFPGRFVQLDQLPMRQIARVAAIDWQRLSDAEGRRLRDLGLDEGVEVEVLHRGWFLFKDPIALRLGRMTVAIRTVHAKAVEVAL